MGPNTVKALAYIGSVLIFAVGFGNGVISLLKFPNLFGFVIAICSTLIGFGGFVLIASMASRIH